MAERRRTEGDRRGDHPESLIRHATGPALAISPLPMPAGLPALVGLLVSAIGFVQLFSPDSLATRLAAVPLSTVATRAYRKHRPALGRATDPLAVNCFLLVSRASHSGIMRQEQATGTVSFLLAPRLHDD